VACEGHSSSSLWYIVKVLPLHLEGVPSQGLACLVVVAADSMNDRSAPDSEWEEPERCGRGGGRGRGQPRSSAGHEGDVRCATSLVSLHPTQQPVTWLPKAYCQRDSFPRLHCVLGYVHRRHAFERMLRKLLVWRGQPALVLVHMYSPCKVQPCGQ
jgi:hypothetical protein